MTNLANLNRNSIDIKIGNKEFKARALTLGDQIFLTERYRESMNTSARSLGDESRRKILDETKLLWWPDIALVDEARSTVDNMILLAWSLCKSDFRPGVEVFRRELTGMDIHPVQLWSDILSAYMDVHNPGWRDGKGEGEPQPGNDVPAEDRS